MSHRRLYYVTSAMLRPDTAQAVQILSMAHAFGEVLGNEFSLVSCDPGRCPDRPQPVFNWNRLFCVSRRRSLRYAEVGLRAAISYGGFRGQRVFTRDIGIAALLNACGADVAYEMHHEFRTIVGRTIFSIMRSRIRFVAISDALKRFMVHDLSVDPARIVVAHDGVFMERYDSVRATPKGELRRALGLPEDRVILMHTGSLYAGRGIELFERVLAAFPEILCVSVGGKATDIDRWREHFGDRKIQMIPHQPPEVLVRYQCAADALFFPMTRLSPIWWCTSPLKLFEYLASGVPIIGCALGSSSEILSRGNAILFDSDNPSTIEHAVSFFLDHRVEAQARADQGRALVAREYTWQKRAARIADFLQ